MGGMNLSDSTTFLVKFAAAVTALIVIARAWLWMAETTTSLKRIVALLPKMELIAKLEPLVDVLSAEFRRNGGSTLADKVRNIEENVTLAATKADAAVHATQKQDKILDDIQRKVNRLSNLPDENGAEE